MTRTTPHQYALRTGEQLVERRPTPEPTSTRRLAKRTGSIVLHCSIDGGGKDGVTFEVRAVDGTGAEPAETTTRTRALDEFGIAILEHLREVERRREEQAGGREGRGGHDRGDESDDRNDETDERGRKSHDRNRRRYDRNRKSHGTSGAVLVFDDVTALLDVVDLERTFQFLHLLRVRVDRAGVGGVYYLDDGDDERDDHARETVAALFEPFGIESIGETVA